MCWAIVKHVVLTAAEGQYEFSFSPLPFFFFLLLSNAICTWLQQHQQMQLLAEK